MTSSNKKRTIDRNYGSASGYSWVNDPFTDKFPWDRHSPCYEENERIRKEKRIAKQGQKGRARNL